MAQSYEPSPRSLSYNAIIDGKFYVWGGTDTTIYGVGKRREFKPKEELTGFVEVFDPHLEEWSRLSTHGSCPPGIFDGASVSKGHYLFTFGGRDRTQQYNSLHQFDAHTRTWTQLSARNPSPNCTMKKEWRCKMLCYEDRLILFGSTMSTRSSLNRSERRNDLCIFDLKKKTWSSPIVTGRPPAITGDFSLTMIDKHRAVMFGGYRGISDSGYINDVCMLDLKRMEWSKVTIQKGRLPPPGRSDHVAVCLGFDEDCPHLLIHGGFSCKGLIMSTLWILDIKSNRWKEVTLSKFTPYKRHTHCAGAFRLGPGLIKVVIFGGRDSHGIVANSVVFLFERREEGSTVEWVLTDVTEHDHLGTPQRLEYLQKKVSDTTKLASTEHASKVGCFSTEPTTIDAAIAIAKSATTDIDPAATEYTIATPKITAEPVITEPVTGTTQLDNTQLNTQTDNTQPDAQPDNAQPDNTQPDKAQSDTQSDDAQQDNTQPDAQSDDTQPDNAQHDNTQPDKAQPEKAQSDTQSDDAQQDNTQPDAQPDNTQPDNAQHDNTQPDIAQPDKTQSDTQPDDAQQDNTQPGSSQPNCTQPQPNSARLINNTAPDDIQPDEDQPDKDQPDNAQPDKAQPDKAQSDKVQSHKVQSDNVQPDNAQSDKTQCNNAQPDDAQSDKAQCDNAQPDDAQSDNALSDNAQPDDAQSDKAQCDNVQPDDAQSDKAQCDNVQPDDAQCDNVQPDDAQSDKAQCDNVQPDDAQSDNALSDNAQPDDAQSDNAQPDKTPPDNTQRDDAQSDNAQPDKTPPDNTQPDNTQPNNAQSNSTQPDNIQPDNTQPDSDGTHPNYLPKNTHILAESIDNAQPEYYALPEDIQPDSAQPNSAQPNSAQPNSAQPNSAQPNSGHPNSTQLYAQPNSTQPDNTQPDNIPSSAQDNSQPDNTRPNNAQPDSCQLNNTQSDKAKLDNDQHKNTQSDNAQPKYAQPNTQFNVQSIKHQPDNAQSVNAQSVKYQPSNGQSVDVQSIKHQPGNGPSVDVQSVKYQPSNGQSVDVQSVKHQPGNAQSVDVQSVKHQPGNAQSVDVQSATQPATTQPATTQPTTSQPTITHDHSATTTTQPKLATAKSLIQKSQVQINLQDKEGKTALMRACHEEKKEDVRQLINKGSKVDLQDNMGQSALMISCENGSRDFTELLLNSGAQVDLQDDQGKTALMKACEKGEKDIVKLLLKNGAQVEIQDNIGQSALIMACKNWSTETAKLLELLLNSGAQVDIQDHEGKTALLQACYSGEKASVDLLLNCGAQVNIQDNTGQSALMIASEIGDVMIAKLLVNNGAKVDIQDNRGKTALIKTCHCEENDSTKLLNCEGQANYNTGESSAATVDKGLSSKKRYAEVADLLIENGANINLQDDEGYSALITACQNGHIQVASHLLDEDVDTYLTDKQGKTAFDIAMMNNNIDILSLFTKLRSKPSFPGILFSEGMKTEMITGTDKTINMEEVGISLSIPKDSLSSADTPLQLEIQPCFSGSFDLPKNMEMVSPAYIIKPSREQSFKKEVLVKIWHHANLQSEQDCEDLVFLSASHTPEYRQNMPVYSFKEIKGVGSFKTGEKQPTGEIALKHFCMLTICRKRKHHFEDNNIEGEVSEAKRIKLESDLYSARLYRAVQSKKVIFCMSLFQPEYIRYCDRVMIFKYGLDEKGRQPIEFNHVTIMKDEITLKQNDTEEWKTFCAKNPARILKNAIGYERIYSEKDLITLGYPERIEIEIKGIPGDQKSNPLELKVEGLNGSFTFSLSPDMFLSANINTTEIKYAMKELHEVIINQSHEYSDDASSAISVSAEMLNLMDRIEKLLHADLDPGFDLNYMEVQSQRLKNSVKKTLKLFKVTYDMKVHMQNVCFYATQLKMTFAVNSKHASAEWHPIFITNAAYLMRSIKNMLNALQLAQLLPNNYRSCEAMTLVYLGNPAPTMRDLSCVRNSTGGPPFKLFPKIAGKWRDIGEILGLEDYLDQWKNKESDERIRNVFSHWRDDAKNLPGDPVRYAYSWDGLRNILEDAGCSEIAEKYFKLLQ